MTRVILSLALLVGHSSCSKSVDPVGEMGRADRPVKQPANPGVSKSPASEITKRESAQASGNIASQRDDAASSKTIAIGSPQNPMPVKRGDFFVYSRGPNGRDSGKRWHEAFYFHPTGYGVALGDHAWMLIDRQEREIGSVYLIDNYPDSVQDGIIRIQEGPKMRYFSLNDGKFLPGAWDHVSPFDRGVACVCNDCLVSDGEHQRVQGGQSWFINDKGKVLRPYSSPTPQCALGHRKDTKRWRVFGAPQ